MDVHGGKGICLGPNNYLGRGYQQMPIAITVEGATRSVTMRGPAALAFRGTILLDEARP